MFINHLNAKQWVLLILSALILLGSLILLGQTFSQTKNIWEFGLIILGILLSIICLAASAILIPDQKVLFLLGLISVPVIMFAFPKTPLQIVAALIFLAGVLLANRYIRGAHKEAMHFSFRRVAGPGLMILATTFVLLVSLNIFFQTLTTLQNNPDNFYEAIAGTIVKGSQPVLSRQVPNYNSDTTTLDDYLKGQAADISQTDSNRVDLSASRQQFAQAFGVPVAGNEKLNNVLKEIVFLKVKNVLAPVQSFVPLIYALLVFLSLRFVAVILIFIAGWVGGGLFRIARATGWVKMNEQTVTVHTPVLS